MTVRGATLSAGDAEGLVLALGESLSLWGAVDRATGEIRDAKHPQHGESIAGRVVVMASGRGSSSTASVLAEMIRSGVAPAAIVLAQPDGILAIGAIVAAELYGLCMPIAVVARDDFPSLLAAEVIGVHADDDGATVTTSAPAPARR